VDRFTQRISRKNRRNDKNSGLHSNLHGTWGFCADLRGREIAMNNQAQTETQVPSLDQDRTAAVTVSTNRHPVADDWVWNYFLNLREDADLAAHAAGGTLPTDSCTYGKNAEELPRLRESVPVLQEAEVGELQQILHDLDAAFEKFTAGFAGYPSPHGSGGGTPGGPRPMAA
jgi:hypothetical protein